MRRSQAPLFHLAESQIRREPNAVQSDKAPAAANFVNVPSHGPTGVVRTVPLKLVGAQPMQLFDGDPVEAVCLSPRTRSTLFGSCCRKALVHHANCRTLPAGMSRWFCQILIGMSWQCGRSDTPFKPHCFIPADVGNQDSALKI